MTDDLAGWRKKSGISLKAIAAKTKISLRYLQAIEGGSFQGLPGGAYGLSYVRQYARAIQFDEDALAQNYRWALTPSTPARPPATWASRLWRRLHQVA